MSSSKGRIPLTDSRSHAARNVVSRWRRRPLRSDDEERARFLLHFELILEGARRADRPFSISRFTFASRDDAVRFHQICLESTRVCDAVRLNGCEELVVWDATPIAAAARAARRLKAKGESTLPTVCNVSTVSYPHAGYTPAALTRSLIRALPDVGSVATAATDTSTAETRRNQDRIAG